MSWLAAILYVSGVVIPLVAGIMLIADKNKSGKIQTIVGYFLLLVSIIMASFMITEPPEANAATREEVAEEIADICIEEWDTYGILPSVAIGQAFVESGLGSGPNLYGVKGQSGRGTVSATYGYLNCLQNQYFRGEANHIRDPETQLAVIMKGGRYCEGQYPGGSYYHNVIGSIYKYGWDRYDAKLQRVLKERERKARKKALRKLRQKRQKLPFTITPDVNIPVGTCVADGSYVKKGSVIIFGNNFYEVTKTKKHIGNVIYIHDPAAGLPYKNDISDWIPDQIYLTEVIENVKG